MVFSDWFLPRWLTAVVCLIWSNVGLAELGSFPPPALRIVYESSGAPSSDSKKSNSTGWRKACANLGRALKIYSGPWGLGFFSSYSCQPTGQQGSPSGRGADTWQLAIKGSASGYVFEISNAAGRLETNITIVTEEPVLEFLQSPEFVDLIAIRLLNDLPAAGLVPKKALNKSGRFSARFPFRRKKSRRQFALIPPAEIMSIFQMRLAPSGKYEATIVGTMQRSGGNKWDALSKERKNLAILSRVTWKVALQNPEESKDLTARDVYLWLQNKEGRGVQNQALDEAIINAVIELGKARSRGLLGKFLLGVSDAILDSTAAGYTGIRYGRQTLSVQEELLKDLRLLGVVTEFNGGPLAGFRFYYDQTFGQRLKQSGVDTSVGWSRIILGKSFGYDLGSVVDRIDLTPKVGIWSFKSVLADAASDSANPIGIEFTLDSAPSLAIEAGAEWRRKSFTSRFWYSFDGAGLLGRVTDRSVTSNRAGVDLMQTTSSEVSFFGLNVNPAIMAFYLIEMVSMTGNGKQFDSTGQTTQKLNVALNFSSGYAGLGFAIGW